MAPFTGKAGRTGKLPFTATLEHKSHWKFITSYLRFKHKSVLRVAKGSFPCRTPCTDAMAEEGYGDAGTTLEHPQQPQIPENWMCWGWQRFKKPGSAGRCWTEQEALGSFQGHKKAFPGTTAQVLSLNSNKTMTRTPVLITPGSKNKAGLASLVSRLPRAARPATPSGIPSKSKAMENSSPSGTGSPLLLTSPRIRRGRVQSWSTLSLLSAQRSSKRKKPTS